MSSLSYPIGPFAFAGLLTPEQRAVCIRQIAATPDKLRNAVQSLDESQLDTEYRPGGWTVRQVIHHVADSHLNNYVRVRLALTEDNPTIKPYNEAHWAELPDARTSPIETSLTLLDCLHKRWVSLLETLSNEDFSRTFNHPELGPVTLDKNVALYAWHGRHHEAHITSLRGRMRW
jgi:uncharacterized damage-inducible protein DinB